MKTETTSQPSSSPSGEESSRDVIRTHNWSGWPGAWCLDCGCDDVLEICLGECTDLPSDENGMPDVSKCKVHVQGPCPEPGSNRHNPYVRKDSK